MKKVIWFFWKSTHIAGRDGQQMALISCAVGKTAAGNCSFVNHGDRQAWKAPQQIYGQHSSAEPASHNDNVDDPHPPSVLGRGRSVQAAILIGDQLILSAGRPRTKRLLRTAGEKTSAIQCECPERAGGTLQFR